MAEHREDNETTPRAEPGVPGGLAAGEEFAGHRIEAEIGRGGMGIVYRARHLALDRDRALKVVAPALSADPAFRKRFQRESRLAASVEHPNVIPVHHAGQEDGVLYLSMRLVDGPDLRQIVDTEGPLPLSRAVRLVDGIAAGLDAAHARGLVHRDVKPANVLVEDEPGGEHVFLTDFGISRISGGGGTLTSSAGFIGSVDYVAPEQIEGERSDHRVDVYALGCLLHYALTGEPPFPRDNDLAKLYAHAHAPRPKPSELVARVPAGIDAVVARAMAIRPEERYDSAGEVADELGRVVHGDRPHAPPMPPSQGGGDEPTRRLRRSPRGRRLAVILGILGALVVAGAITAVLLANRGHNATPPNQSQAASPPKGPQPKAVATVKVGAGPVALAIDDSNVWVACLDAHALDAIVPGSARLADGPITLTGSPVSVAAGFGALWVADASAGLLERVDPTQGTAPISIPVGTNPSDVAVDKHWVWVTNKSSNSVSRIDPTTNQVDRTISVGQSPWSIATGAGSVWVANIDGSSVSQIDPELGRVVGKPIAVGERPNDLAVGYGSLWVTDVFNGTLTRIDPIGGKVMGRPIEVGARPRGVSTGLGNVWVANGGDGTVSRIDPKTGTPASPPIRVGTNPADIVVGDGAVWTANFDDSTVTKIRP